MDSIHEPAAVRSCVPHAVDTFTERLRARRHILSPRMRQVANYIDSHRPQLLALSAVELAKEIGVSDATVIRTVQALGFEGLVDLKDVLGATLGRSHVIAAKMARTVDELRHDADRAFSYVLQEHHQALAALAAPGMRSTIAAAAALLTSARRIGIFGIGSCGVLADYAKRLFTRNGMPSYTLNRTGIELSEQLLEVAAGDALIVMVQKNLHREVQAVMHEAVRLRVDIILITGQPRHPLARESTHVIVIPRGRSQDLPLHGPTLACLEMLMLGAVSARPDRSVDTMDRLLSHRERLRPRR